nr:MAG TPA: hypothetical protein [Caudoviricetes sp.]
MCAVRLSMFYLPLPLACLKYTTTLTPCQHLFKTFLKNFEAGEKIYSHRHNKAGGNHGLEQA